LRGGLEITANPIDAIAAKKPSNIMASIKS
jgi:hypothetical protein